MPIYEYHCRQCDARFELLRKMDNHPDRCPQCNTQCTVCVQVSRSNFALTGTGWYKTDYGAQR